MRTLDLVAFAGASNWPLWAGEQLGLFEKEGFRLVLKITPNSIHMAEVLHDGSAQVALTSLDNVVAYANGHGEVPLDGPLDLLAFMGVDDGLLSVMAQPDIEAVASLRGKALAVDALTTGYAFVLKEILAKAGLGDSDVTYLSVGTGAERLAALKAGTCGATLLNAPLCLAAENFGKKRLVRAQDILGSYQGIVGTARRVWARDNAELLQSFIRAFHASIQWLNDPANKEAACAILAERLPAIRPVVDLAYKVLVTDGGLQRNLEIDRKGAMCVIDLRRRYGNRQLDLGTPELYTDDAFRRAALG